MEERQQVQTWMADDAGEKWLRMRALRGAAMAEATELMLDLAGVQPGSRVLDVAAGTGDQSIDAAQRVGPSGYVLATDLSESMLKAAAEAAHQAGLANMETRVADGQQLDLEPDSFDAAICRNGLMFFPDRRKALQSIWRVLKPGCRVAVVVWARPEKNPWHSVSTGVLERYGGQAQTMSIAFSMGEPGLLEDLLASGGFRDVSVRPVPVIRRFDSTAAAVEGMKSSPPAESIAQLAEDDQARAWRDIEAELKRFEGPSGVEIPGEALVGAGVK
ncbi:MAG TPA: class I SAM-dependent methyltransferase [Chloroflexota bacterium]